MCIRDRINSLRHNIQNDYSSHLYSESNLNPTKITVNPPTYEEEDKKVDGRIILRDNFREILKKYDNVLIFGEDAGKIGGVNQALEGLQETFGKKRVFDTGIREATIIGQGIGLSMRGLRPISEIQYLDYLLYSIQLLSDDLASCLLYTSPSPRDPKTSRMPSSA